MEKAIPMSKSKPQKKAKAKPKQKQRQKQIVKTNVKVSVQSQGGSGAGAAPSFIPQAFSDRGGENVRLVNLVEQLARSGRSRVEEPIRIKAPIRSAPIEEPAYNPANDEEVVRGVFNAPINTDKPVIMGGVRVGEGEGAFGFSESESSPVVEFSESERSPVVESKKQRSNRLARERRERQRILAEKGRVFLGQPVVEASSVELVGSAMPLFEE
jgi:hypothetical protein